MLCVSPDKVRPAGPGWASLGLLEGRAGAAARPLLGRCICPSGVLFLVLLLALAPTPAADGLTRSPPPMPQTLANFSVWRWCFFLGCWPPIYWGTRALMWALTKFAECRLFTARTAVYFLVGGCVLCTAVYGRPRQACRQSAARLFTARSPHQTSCSPCTPPGPHQLFSPLPPANCSHFGQAPAARCCSSCAPASSSSPLRRCSRASQTRTRGMACRKRSRSSCVFSVGCWQLAP